LRKVRDRKGERNGPVVGGPAVGLSGIGREEGNGYLGLCNDF